MATRAIDEDLELLQVLDLQGVDVLGRSVVRIVGKFFPAPAIDVERLKVYVLQKLLHELHPGPYVIVYFHSAVQRQDNSPGAWALRDLYEFLPNQLKHRLQAVYYVHPGLRSRLLLATLGRFFLSEGFYSKVVYINRLEFLSSHVKKGQVDIPEFVVEHDKKLEARPLMDYGFEVDPVPLDPALRLISHSTLDVRLSQKSVPVNLYKLDTSRSAGAVSKRRGSTILPLLLNDKYRMEAIPLLDPACAALHLHIDAQHDH